MTDEKLKEIAEKLSALPTKQPKRSIAGTVEFLRPQILDLRKNGYSWVELCAALKAEGLPISVPTLRSHLKDAGLSATKPRETTKAKPKRAVVKTASSSHAKHEAEPAQAARKDNQAETKALEIAPAPFVRKSAFHVRPDTDDI